MDEIRPNENLVDYQILRDEFEKCREEFNRRAYELTSPIKNDARCRELIQEEMRLARLINDKDVYKACYDDALDFDDNCKDNWEMLEKVADLGELDSLWQVAEYYCFGYTPFGVDFDKAAHYAMEYVRHGGRADGFESIKSISPEHDALVDHEVHENLIAAICKLEPTKERKYYRARCLWDIEKEMCDVLSIPELIGKVTRGANTLKAISLYREAANEGYFWSLFYLGMYFTLSGGDERGVGIAYLEDAKNNAPINGSLTSEQKEQVREVVEIIEKTLFSCTGKISNRVKMLEGQLRQGNLSAAPELAVAYMKGEECPKDRDKAFDCAAGLLFHDEEFAELVHLMHDLPDNDRVWLEKKLNAEAQKVEAEEVNGGL